MAESSKFDFSLQELTSHLINLQHLHDGKWMLAFEFGFGAANIGPTPAETKPAAFVQINKVSLVRVTEPVPPEATLVIDAAINNPKPGSGKAAKPASKPVSRRPK